MSFSLGAAATLTFGMMVSEHVGFCPDCNEVHPYAKVAFDTPSDRVDLGLTAFINSQNRFGVLLGGEYRSLYTPWGVDAGLAFGYEAEWSVVPITRVTYDVAPNATLFATPAPTSIKRLGSLDSWSVVVGVDLQF